MKRLRRLRKNINELLKKIKNDPEISEKFEIKQLVDDLEYRFKRLFKQLENKA